MRPPSRWLFLALAPTLLACNAEPPSGAAENIACPLTERVRLASAPGDFDAGDVFYALHLVGDHLLFTFERVDSDERVYWHTPRCGGPLAEFTSLPAGMLPLQTVQTPGGPVLYSQDTQGVVHVADRLDVDGFDEPRPVTGLPALPLGYPLASQNPRDFALFQRTSNPYAQVRGVAGLSGSTKELHAHGGDPDAPSVRLGDAVVMSLTTVDDRLYLLDDDGTLRRVDPTTGASETLQTDVRYAAFSPDGQRAIWQELGDDTSEPVHLRDLATGIDLEIATNDFARDSWNRKEVPGEPEPYFRDIGTWVWTQDSAYAAQIGPEGALVAAVRADTGEPLVLPAHVGVASPLSHHFTLTLADPFEQVRAHWDPATGALVEWHRGPTSPSLRHSDDATADYMIPDPELLDRGPLVRVDLATGAVTELLPQISQFSLRLAPDRYINAPLNAEVIVAAVDAGTLATYSQNYSLVDLATDTYFPLADDITGHALLPDSLIVLDAHGPDPGVWAIPFPK